jgi:hypothetical protein
MKRLLGLAIAALSLATAPPAQAGVYDVKACFTTPGGTIGNGSWAPDVPGPYVTAYTACPGDGIVTRMSGASDGSRAPYGASARHVFTAPPGTHVVGFRANVRQNAFRGWYAGLVDSTPRWIWCGNACTTWGQYWWTEVRTHTPQLMAQVTCGDLSGCPRWNLDGIMAIRDVIVTVEDTVPPGVAITGGSVTAGGWRRGNQDVRYSAWDATGIREVHVLVDGQKRGGNFGRCFDSTARPCEDDVGGFPLPAELFLNDGRHTVTVKAFDGAWNTRETSRQILIDRSAPAQPLDAQIVGANGWQPQNSYEVQWRNPQQTAAPIIAARYMICPDFNRAGETRGCIQGVRSARNIESISGLRVPRPGDWRLTLWLEDQAGNADRERSVTMSGLQFDETPPQLAFLRAASSDPTRVRVAATDATSGVGEAWIEARRQGEDAWRSLPTTLETDGFSAILDDEMLPKGHYALRARAKDLAGNERSTEMEWDGTPATRTLPLRLGTRLAVGKPKRVGAKGARGKRRYRTVLVVRPKARYGRTIPLTGRLTTPGANALADADVEVWERVKLPSAEWRRVGQVRTSSTGRFRFKALRGPSRTLRFRYPGTATIRAQSKQIDLRVRAVTSLRVTRSRVVNGEEIRFRGRLKGRQSGATGKLIHLQVYTRGRWSTFATPRANRGSGAWSVPYRFTATRGRVTYRFRALIPRETSFPYETGVSRSVRVTVQGL